MNKTNKKNNQNKSIILFNQNQVRRHWDESERLWYFSIVDVVAVLVESKDPKDYWYRVKKRLSDQEKVELSTICRQLKLMSSDNKRSGVSILKAPNLVASNGSTSGIFIN